MARPKATGVSQTLQNVDQLQNPLHAVVAGFTCSSCGFFDVNGTSDSTTGCFSCVRCIKGAPTSLRCAYTTLIYGDNPYYVAGALALGFSLESSLSSYDRVLLHTSDVPAEALRPLSCLWKLQEVSYVRSDPDLHVPGSRFHQVFTKLHMFNPDVLPYDRVTFLDTDMIVLRNIDELFELRPPAAMSNSKHSNGLAKLNLRHGERIDIKCSYINAGTMVVAPSKELFELLVADVGQPDFQWHRQAWSPEQQYLSALLAGEWTHVDHRFNFEVQVHSGVPVSDSWQSKSPCNIAVAHFSGQKKAWDIEPDQDLPAVASLHSQQMFDSWPAETKLLVEARCQVLHQEWHHVFALALRAVRLRLARPEIIEVDREKLLKKSDQKEEKQHQQLQQQDESLQEQEQNEKSSQPNSSINKHAVETVTQLVSGTRSSLDGHDTAITKSKQQENPSQKTMTTATTLRQQPPQAKTSSESASHNADFWCQVMQTGRLRLKSKTAEQATALEKDSFALHPGDSVIVHEEGAEFAFLATIICRSFRHGGTCIVWRYPFPSEIKAGHTWVAPRCCEVGQSGNIMPLEHNVDLDAASLDLGSKVVAWLGRGHFKAVVVAKSSDEHRLLAFPSQGLSCIAPQWLPTGELLREEEVNEECMLQCSQCLL
eukprot:TRINITY_DN33986_c0_g1_i1.p1 TRINITY_DN33986_c0_g1~~TRINITY_DN33986_c0_g1_i1.p1  ORF type:complete len:654 (-),score=112.60 TRINITY_DN33986_c0_g1_i1:244-2205(-)